jgi:predicted PurR-regulated permease PerM
MDPIILVVIVIVAIVLSVGFLLFIFSIVPALTQLRLLLSDLQRTSTEARILMSKLNEIGEKVNQDIDKVDSILDASKETVETASKSLRYINKNILKNSAGFLAFLPAIKLGWTMVKKFKGGKS